MTSISRLFRLSMLIFLTVSSLLSLNIAIGSESNASSAIKTGEKVLVSAYEAVVEAEQAGGNISSLVTQLSEAGNFLAAARMSYRIEDFDEAIHLANLSRSVGEKVQDEAHRFRNLGWKKNTQRMWFTMINSISWIAIIASGSLLLWRSFKSWYYKHVLRMRPELASDDS